MEAAVAKRPNNQPKTQLNNKRKRLFLTSSPKAVSLIGPGVGVVERRRRREGVKRELKSERDRSLACLPGSLTFRSTRTAARGIRRRQKLLLVKPADRGGLFTTREKHLSCLFRRGARRRAGMTHAGLFTDAPRSLVKKKTGAVIVPPPLKKYTSP